MALQASNAKGGFVEISAKIQNMHLTGRIIFLISQTEKAKNTHL
jgi:hypothetical protein